MQTLIRRRVLRRLIRICVVCQRPSPAFTDSPVYIVLWRHSDKNRVAINSRYLDFGQTDGLILLVNDNHVDNNLKEILNNLNEILVYVYYHSIVNNRPKAAGYVAKSGF